MANELISITDANGDDFTFGGCLERIAGNLTVTISVDGAFDPTAITNQNGYQDGTLVDNGDGTWSFDMDAASLFLDGLCIPIIVFTDEPCELLCPVLTIDQQVDSGSVNSILSIDTDDTVTSFIVNGNTFGSTEALINDALSSDCYTYVIEILLNDVCLFEFDVILPACTTSATIEDCTTVDLCTINTPDFEYECLPNGDIEVTLDSGGGTVIAELTEWSNDGLSWNNFSTIFTPSSETGYIRYLVDYEDGCDPKEVVKEFACPFDCENFAECECEYDQATNEYLSNCNDNFTSTVSTDDTLYYIDGSLIGIPYTLGTPIDSTGINEISFKRTIVFDDACDDLIIEWGCSKVSQDCDYVLYDLTCTHDINSNSITPTFTGDESILTVSEKTYSVDGSNYAPYLGGSIPANNFALFKWKIKIEGCDLEVLTSACYIPCPCPTIEFPDEPIKVVIDGCVSICDEEMCLEVCSKFGTDPNKVVIEVTASGVPLSTITGFNFPYSDIQIADLEADLNTYISSNGGGSAMVTLQDMYLNGNIDSRTFCIRTNSSISFESIETGDNTGSVIEMFAPCVDCGSEGMSFVGTPPSCQQVIMNSTDTSCTNYSQILFVDLYNDCGSASGNFDILASSDIVSWEIVNPCEITLNVFSNSTNAINYSYLHSGNNCTLTLPCYPSDYPMGVLSALTEVKATDKCGVEHLILILFGEN